MSVGWPATPVELKLPATSANLGPGFDALGLAMDFHLHVRAELSSKFHITASGRNAASIEQLDDNLIVSTYREVLATAGIDALPLSLLIRNEIPLGMGCGSSAAALVAGVALAAHFGSLRWSREKVLTEASLREGHPDNVAACVLGGLTVSAMHSVGSGPARVAAVSLQPLVRWKLLLAFPQSSLSTKKARALLPEQYSRAAAVTNVQNASLLTAAFATGRGDVLQTAMNDRLHQPYRSQVCPLLPALLPLAGAGDVLGVALSGAGPSVLLVLREDADAELAVSKVKQQAMQAGLSVETLLTSIAGPAALFFAGD